VGWMKDRDPVGSCVYAQFRLVDARANRQRLKLIVRQERVAVDGEKLRGSELICRDDSTPCR
jgi:hypothetical protein